MDATILTQIPLAIPLAAFWALSTGGLDSGKGLTACASVSGISVGL